MVRWPYRRSASLALTAAAVSALVVGACSSGSSHATSPTTERNGSGTSESTGTLTTPPTTSLSGKGVTATDQNGYSFQVSLAAPVTTATTFTTNDSSGAGGTTIDTPPGKILIVAKLTYTNKTSRQEPLDEAADGNLPEYGNTNLSTVYLGVPQSDAATFGVTAEGTYDVGCGNQTALVPAGYCDLGETVVAFSPAQTDITAPPEVAAGSSGTVTILALGEDDNNAIPQNAPVGDVKVFVQTSASCQATAPGCLVALN